MQSEIALPELQQPVQIIGTAARNTPAQLSSYIQLQARKHSLTEFTADTYKRTRRHRNHLRVAVLVHQPAMQQPNALEKEKEPPIETSDPSDATAGAAFEPLVCNVKTHTVDIGKPGDADHETLVFDAVAELEPTTEKVTQQKSQVDIDPPPDFNLCCVTCFVLPG